MKRIIILGLVLASTAIFTGCSSSRVHFEEPLGAKIFLHPSSSEDVGYTFPVALDLEPTDYTLQLFFRGKGEPIKMILPDGTKLTGDLYVNSARMTQVERLALVKFILTSEQITKLRAGYAVIVTGYSAASRPVYRINLGLDK